MPNNGVTHKLTKDEIDNTRFYGATFARTAQMDTLDQDVKAKTGQSTVMNQTVDNLNKRIGITSQIIKRGFLGTMRKLTADAVTKTAPASNDEEARAWGEWLSEPSRITALLMPEIGADDCIRDRKLDKNLEDKEFEEDKNEISTVMGGPNRKNSSFVPTTKEANSVYQSIDPEKKIIYKGDLNRRDNKSNWINSGTTISLNGDEYAVYWMQEGAGTDSSSDKKNTQSFSWTPKLKNIFQSALSQPDGSVSMALMDQFQKEAEHKYTFKKQEKAKMFRDKVQDEALNWMLTFVQNRFFRLTSLMGMDFFVNRGNAVRFARDDNQQNFTGGSANRVITDSEWAHANEMGYLQSGKVQQYGNNDRFSLQQ